MSVELISDAYGAWVVDWQLVRMIVRSHANSWAILENGVRTNTSQVDWYNPFSWGMPELVNYQVNWSQMRRDRDRLTEEMMEDLQRNISNSVPGVKERLQQLVFETEANRASFRNNMNSASRQTMQNINASVEGYETAIEVSKITRDVSGEVFMVGATFLSGGAALGAIAGGSAFKGVATYQDTDSVGAALIETSGSFIMTVIPLARGTAGTAAAGASRAESIATEGAIVFLDAQFEVAKGLVSGDTLQQAMARGGMKVVTAGTGAGMDKVLKSSAVRNMMAKTGIPARMVVSRGSSRTISTGDLGAGVTKGLVNQQVVGRAGGAAINQMNPQGAGSSSQNRSSLAAEPAGRVCLANESTCARREMVDQAIQPAECR